MILNNIKIAVCDDEKIFIEQVKECVEKYSFDSGIAVSIDSYTDSPKILKKIIEEKRKYDIYFLDIDMPTVNGVELAEAVRNNNDDAIICFITSKTGYTRAAYKLDALAYIEKPIEYVEIEKAMKRAIAEITFKSKEEEANNIFFTIKTPRDEEIIDTRKILYIEKLRNKCIFHMDDREYVCYDTLKNIHQRLNKNIFVFTHQGYIVNFNYIKEVKQNSVALSKELEIPLSRSHRDSVKKMHLSKIKRLIAEEQL